MAAFWVQYWGYLPAIVEEAMDEVADPAGRQRLGARRDLGLGTTHIYPPGRLSSPSENPQAAPSSIRRHSAIVTSRASESTGASHIIPTSYLPQPGPPTMVSQPAPSEQSLSYSLSGSTAQGLGSYPFAPNYAREPVNPFNMTAMSSSLPEYHSNLSLPSFPQHRLPSSTSTPSMMYQFQQAPQFAGQTALSYSNNPNWMAMQLPSQYHSPYPQTSGAPASHNYLQQVPAPPTHPTALGLGQHLQVGSPWAFQHQMQSANPYYFIPGAYEHSQSRAAGRHGQVAPRRASLPLIESFANSQPGRAGRVFTTHAVEGMGAAHNITSDFSASQTDGTQGYGGAERSSNSLRPSVPRGPPRKPKQSGHALWVGNLPPVTNVFELKDYFSRDATHDIESVFLISKSNCAFVNYKTEDSCAAAMTRFHDSRFKGVRLVCRLRRTLGNPVPGVPTGPASLVGTVPGEAKSDRPPAQSAGQESRSGQVRGESGESVRDSKGPKKDRFFIVKSLTIEDLESSVRNGIWTTQAHNEITLNEAYASANNVYLIFSANKSGEYFGYARMTAPITEDAASAITWAPKVHRTQETNHPRAIATPATEFAPKGRVIDDSARGTIFWEADTDEGEAMTTAGSVDGLSDGGDASEAEDRGGSTFSKGSGRPFKIEWISTTRLPFYRTRGLRNPWNANREVKIARDGTELEPSVGTRLLQMFHRAAAVTATVGQHHHLTPTQASVVGPHQYGAGLAPVPFYGQLRPTR